VPAVRPVAAAPSAAASCRPARTDAVRRRRGDRRHAARGRRSRHVVAWRGRLARRHRLARGAPGAGRGGPGRIEGSGFGVARAAAPCNGDGADPGGAIGSGIDIGCGAASVGRGGRAESAAIGWRSAPGGDVVVSDGPSPSAAASSTPTMKSPM